MKNLFRPVVILLLVLGSMLAKAQVPVLNSYPSASAVIFLDFDGHTVAGTSWNYNGPIPCGNSGLDDARITEVFNRVAEDYRPFNVNVTTDSTKFLAAPLNRRMRCVLTTSSSWYGNAGGVAFVGSFIWSDNTPCFVFTALLGSNAKNIAEATSHEVGHTLGLYHQALYDANCVKLSDYYSGVGTGETSWAPIMGVGYYRNVTTWYNGPNSYGCTNYQSDLDIIVAQNGFSYRGDDFAATFNQAPTLAFNNNQFQTAGMIERNTDVDMFKFVVPTDYRFVLDAMPSNAGVNSGSNLDMKVTLYNNSQNVLNVYNPTSQLSARIDTLLTPGTYYLKIEAVGNQYTPVYASLGNYTLQGQLLNGTLPLHKLELKGLLVGDNHKLTWEIIADEQITDLIIESSEDGRNFAQLTRTNNDDRSFMYRPFSTNTIQYRLNVTFDDGRQYYSNIVTLRQDGTTARPQLVSTLINGNSIVVNSPATYNYQLFDLSGRVLRNGKLVAGTNSIDASGLINGMYLIRYANEVQQWTDRLIRQ